MGFWVSYKRGDYVVSEVEDFWYKSVWIVKQAWSDSLLCVRPFEINDLKVYNSNIYRGSGVMFNVSDVSPLAPQIIVELKLKGIALPSIPE